ncbi:MAG: GAF domain-containing protein [Pyrinomonadaceae bacterium]
MPTDQEIKSYGSAAALHALVERVGLIVRAENAAIGSVSSAPRAITWRASVDGANGFRSLRALAGAEALQRIEASQGFVVFERIDDSAEVRSEREALLLMTRRSESKDLLVFPLRARGALIGALAVQMASSSQVTVEDKVLLESFAELAALTLDNILLFEIVNRTQHVWEQTFDAIQDGIIVYDERPCIRRCNLHAAQLLGLSSPIEAIGLSEKESFARLFGEHAASYHVTKRTGITSSFEPAGRRRLALPHLYIIFSDCFRHGKLERAHLERYHGALCGSRSALAIATPGNGRATRGRRRSRNQ